MAVTIIIISSNYIHYKMKNELIIYYMIINDLETLNDTYSLCSGLLITNPSNTNLKSCDFIYNKIELKLTEIKENCPYIYFYTKYVK